MEDTNILIIGATGFIGSFLYEHLKSLGRNNVLIGTYCKHYDPEMLPLDLSDEISEADIERINRKFDNKVDVVIITSAISRIDQCVEEYAKSKNINLLQSRKIIKYYASRSSKIIFLSSEAVYDGRGSFYKETDQVIPLNLYGRYKLEIESYIAQCTNDFLILRLGTVLSDSNHSRNLIHTLAESLINGDLIKNIKDRRFNPVGIMDIAKIIELSDGLTGVFNIGMDEPIYRIELARKMKKRLNSRSQIIEVDQKELPFKEPRAIDTTMTNNKIKNALNFEFCNLDTLIDTYLEKRGKVYCIQN
jgi:dTDP-4-dehydrorhamnose reductase